MKVAPVSADLLIKLALLAGGIGLAWYLFSRAKEGLSAATASAGQAVAQVADAVIAGVNPASDKNFVYGGANALGGALTGQGSNFTVGGWLYDVTHPDPVMSPPQPAVNLDFYDVPTLGFGA